MQTNKPLWLTASSTIIPGTFLGTTALHHCSGLYIPCMLWPLCQACQITHIFAAAQTLKAAVEPDVRIKAPQPTVMNVTAPLHNIEINEFAYCQRPYGERAC
jgi:hypothetical protein